LLAPRPTPKLEDHPLSAVRDCLFNIFAATLHIGGRSSIHNLRTRNAVVTRAHLSRIDYEVNISDLFIVYCSEKVGHNQRCHCSYPYYWITGLFRL